MALFLTLGILLPAQITVHAEKAVPNGYYYIRNKATGTYLDVPNSQIAWFTQVIAYPFNGDDNQYWEVQDGIDGYCRIRSNLHTNYFLDVENGSFIGEDYFEHLLAEIREIRLSERRFYQKLTDIYATSIDYNLNAPTTRMFFKKVQNKMHYAVHGHTAAELIVNRADAEREHMGLTTWEKAPNGKIVKTDVSVAKNYLKGNELEAMGRIVNAFLDVAEDMAKRHIPMTMEDWAKRIDKFLDVTDRPVLSDNGKVSAEYAKEYAETEFEKFRVIQDRLFQSDFDKLNNNSLPSLDFND